MNQSDHFAPYNAPMYRDDPFAPWHDPMATEEDYEWYKRENNIRD
ncbi:hypothetical protein LCGC14_1068930 [marine sediment metagenome]|uniref:Uncharacterized protein n=1 Tax=marine sediment metagenome TaxID=412755 RepID=A0A0F9QPM5_9ZZZZ